MSKITNKNTKRVLVTAALPYSNGCLHVGHIAGAYLPADIYVRFLRLRGIDVRFICGSDDHGVAILITADKEGKTPAEVAKFYHDKQQKDFAGLGINFDVYGSTSRNLYHYKTSQDFFLKLYEQGRFEKEKTSQFYDESRSMFLPDRYIKGTCGYCGTPDQNGDQCENCGKMLDVETLKDARSVISGQPAVIKDTVHWFLDLSHFEEAVREWIDSAVIREHSRSYVKGLLSTGFVRRSMTRDIEWGIPLPLDDPDAKGKVLYVWFDAPIGYISNTKEVCANKEGDPERYADWWKDDDSEIVHFIGEDNTIFHCITWIATLKAEGTFKLPKGVIVNHFLNIQFPGDTEEEKISKSRGTAVWIGDYLGEGNNPDVLRYYLTAIAPEKARTVYKPEDLIQRNNTDLANILGNFINRIVSFTHKYLGPQIPERLPSKVSDLDTAFAKDIQETFVKVTDLLEDVSFRAALETIMDFCRRCNKYVDDKAPWAQRKTDLEATALTLSYCFDAIHFLAVVLSPFIPFTAEKIAAMLNLDLKKLTWDDALKPQAAGSQINQAEILFSKIEEVK